MDDETYCFEKFKYLTGQGFYPATSQKEDHENLKRKFKTKFPENIKYEDFVTTGMLRFIGKNASESVPYVF